MPLKPKVIRVKLIKDATEKAIIKGLPKASVCKEEKDEIKQSIAEMKKGNCVTLDELKSA